MSEQAKHTPAPWVVYKGAMNMDGGLNPFFRGIVALLKHSGEDDDVCVILDRNESAHDYEANACLIAAAPDLLEALQHIIEHGGATDVPSCEGCTKGRRLALAAIAKATGGAS